MTDRASENDDAANDRLSDQYREAVGRVIAARQHCADVSTSDGPESQAAKDAEANLTQVLKHRDDLRERYDRVIDRRLKR